MKEQTMNHTKVSIFLLLMLLCHSSLFVSGEVTTTLQVTENKKRNVSLVVDSNESVLAKGDETLTHSDLLTTPRQNEFIGTLRIDYIVTVSACVEGDPCNRPVPCVSGERIADPENCTQYYTCNFAGSWEITDCSRDGLKFDSETCVCRQPNEATCQPPCVTGTGITTPPTPAPALCDADNTTTCRQGVKAADKSSCYHYFQCLDDEWIRQECSPPGSVFDIYTEGCIPNSPSFDCEYRCETPTPNTEPWTTPFTAVSASTFSSVSLASTKSQSYSDVTTLSASSSVIDDATPSNTNPAPVPSITTTIGQTITTIGTTIGLTITPTDRTIGLPTDATSLLLSSSTTSDHTTIPSTVTAAATVDITSSSLHPAASSSVTAAVTASVNYSSVYSTNVAETNNDETSASVAAASSAAVTTDGTPANNDDSLAIVVAVSLSVAVVAVATVIGLAIYIVRKNKLASARLIQSASTDQLVNLEETNNTNNINHSDSGFDNSSPTSNSMLLIEEGNVSAISLTQLSPSVAGLPPSATGELIHIPQPDYHDTPLDHLEIRVDIPPDPPIDYHEQQQQQQSTFPANFPPGYHHTEPFPDYRHNQNE